MPRQRTRRGFTWIELIVVLVICAVLVGLLIPAIMAAREAARLAQCTNNMKMIGLGLHNYLDARHYYPGSAEMVGKIPNQKVGGWSFLFKSIPGGFYEWSGAFEIAPLLIKDTLANDESKRIDPLTHQDTTIQNNRNLEVPEFLCPSNPYKTYENPANKKIAFTNYKAMGATSAESLILCENPNAPPPYGKASQHPDGALFPTNNGIRIQDISDGIGHTFMVVETIDDTKSCWLAGADTTLVGMPVAQSYQYNTERDSAAFWEPLDFNGQYNGKATPALQAMRTYTAFDFRPGHADTGTYPASVGRTPAYGPSSGHPGVVNHLFCDGSVRSIHKEVDYAAYFFAITRNNTDPSQGPNQYLEP
jgi:prepilin-type N-terminal cleavage/methylation domain-containing protein